LRRLRSSRGAVGTFDAEATRRNMSARKPFCRSRLDCGGHFAGVAVCCRARNAGSTGSAWRLRDPELGGSGVAVGVGSASEPACVFERAEGAVDLAAFLVAAEQVAGLGAADPVVAVSCERPDVVSGWVAERPGAAWLGPKPVSTGNGPSAQLPLKVLPKQPQPSTRPRACWVGSQPAPSRRADHRRPTGGGVRVALVSLQSPTTSRGPPWTLGRLSSGIST